MFWIIYLNFGIVFFWILDTDLCLRLLICVLDCLFEFWNIFFVFSDIDLSWNIDLCFELFV